MAAVGPASGKPSPWDGRGILQSGFSWFSGHAGDGQPHAHHAIQFLLAPEPQRIWTRVEGVNTLHGVVIKEQVEHQLFASEFPIDLLYVDPQSDFADRLRRLSDDPVIPIKAETVRRARRALQTFRGSLDIDALIGCLVHRVGEPEVRHSKDLLMQQVMDALHDFLPDPVSASQLAAMANLSKDRFLHRFRQHAGLPLRPYLRWRRLQLALEAVLSGKSLTDAAVLAGFSDAAHFTRTCRRHFGMAPSAFRALRRPL